MVGARSTLLGCNWEGFFASLVTVSTGSPHAHQGVTCCHSTIAGSPNALSLVANGLCGTRGSKLVHIHEVVEGDCPKDQNPERGLARGTSGADPK